MAGRAAYFIDSDRRTEVLGKDAVFSQGIVLSVFPSLAGQSAEAPGTSLIVGGGYGISSHLEAGSAQEKASVAVLKVLLSREVQQLRWELGLGYPTRRDVTSPAMKPLEAARASFYQAHNGTPVLDASLDTQVFTPLAKGLQELGLGRSTPEEVAARVQKAFESWKN